MRFERENPALLVLRLQTAARKYGCQRTFPATSPEDLSPGNKSIFDHKPLRSPGARTSPTCSVARVSARIARASDEWRIPNLIRFANPQSTIRNLQSCDRWRKECLFLLPAPCPCSS